MILMRISTGCGARRRRRTRTWVFITSCQGLGRKNKHEILKTDRMGVAINSTTYVSGHSLQGGAVGGGAVHGGSII